MTMTKISGFIRSARKPALRLLTIVGVIAGSAVILAGAGVTYLVLDLHGFISHTKNVFLEFHKEWLPNETRECQSLPDNVLWCIAPDRDPVTGPDNSTASHVWDKHDVEVTFHGPAGATGWRCIRREDSFSCDMRGN